MMMMVMMMERKGQENKKEESREKNAKVRRKVVFILHRTFGAAKGTCTITAASV